MEKKMTEKEMFAMIMSFEEATEEVKAFCEKKIAALDRKAEKARETAAKKRAETDELYDAVFIELTLEPQTADEILEHIEIEDATKAKIQARLKKMIDKGVVEKTDVKRDKRTIKGYYLVG